jgi:glycosyltransferase involved in cell wall biosynthesis
MAQGSNKQRRLKAARIIARLNIGGPARQVCFLHERLRDEFDTILITGQLDAGEGDMSGLLNSPEGVYKIGTLSRPIRLFSDLRSVGQTYQILRKERPDIVHTHTAKAGAIGRVAALLAGVPVRIHTYHGHVFSGYFSPSVTRMFIGIERWLNRFTTAVIAISESQRKELVEVYKVASPEQTRVIPTGFELKFDNARAERDPKVMNVTWTGRLVPIKGVDLLAEVIELAARELPLAKFSIAGDGPERSKLQRLPCKNFELLGWQQDLSPLWLGSDVALLTSINEGTPASLIEAMASGIPFVATKVGGVPDIAGSSEAPNGLLCDRTAASIVAALKLLSANPALAEKMGQNASAFARSRHSAEALERNIRGLYRELTADGSDAV